MQDHDLLEFEKLKDEQIGRLTYRDTLFYFTIVIIGGGLATAYSANKEAAVILLVLPWAIFIAGVAHITCDRRIEDIGDYIRDRLAPVIADRTKTPRGEVFAWEDYFRNSRWHWARKLLQFATNLMLYSGAGIASMWLFPLLRHCTPQQLNQTETIFFDLGHGLMVIMALLITAFTYFKWQKRPRANSPKKRSVWPVVARLVLAGVAAGIAALAIVNADRFVQGSLGGWFHGPAWQIAPLSAVAAVAALVVWSFVLAVSRR